MSLTTKTMIELKDKSFDQLYEAAGKDFTASVNLAVEFVRLRGAAGEKVLLGDVAEVLKGVVEIHPSFLAHLKQRKLSPGSWPLDFAEYVLEQAYPQPELKAVQWKGK